MATALDDVVVGKRSERTFYTWAAVVAALVVFAGFARTYYVKGAFGTPDLSALKHLHGFVMTAWFTLFLVQVRLVATGRTRIHRKLGVAGAGPAAVVVVVGPPGAPAARLPRDPAGRHGGLRGTHLGGDPLSQALGFPQAAHAARFAEHPHGGRRAPSARFPAGGEGARVFCA